MKKRIAVFFMAVVLIAMFAGCNMISVNETRDGRQVVAAVNGEEILKSTVLNQAKLYLTQYGYSESADNYNDYLNAALEQFLEEEIVFVLLSQKCDELGIERITAEQEQELETAKTTFYNNIYTSAENKYPEDEYDDEAERKELVEEYAQSRLEQYGYFNGSYEKSYYSSYLAQNIKDYLTKDYNPTDEDIKAFYDQELKDQKSVSETSKAQFESFESDGILLYVPEGVRYVKNLLIAIPEDIRSKITSLRSSDSTEEADALRDEELAKIKDKADAAYSAALEDFDKALAEYGEDPGMTSGSSAETGYRIYENNTTYDTIFTEAGMALAEIGDISKPTPSDFGYYIVQYVSDMTSGEVSFDEARDAVLKYMTDKNTSESYTVSLGSWLEDSDIVRYRDRLVSED